MSYFIAQNVPDTGITYTIEQLLQRGGPDVLSLGTFKIKLIKASANVLWERLGRQTGIIVNNKSFQSLITMTL